MHTELMDQLADMMELITDLPVVVGSLPKDNAIAIYTGGGAPSATFFSRNLLEEVLVAVNAKHQEQHKALQALSTIHRKLANQEEYSPGADWRIVNITTSSSPTYLGEEDNGQYLFGSILLVMVYKKGGTEDE